MRIDRIKLITEMARQDITQLRLPAHMSELLSKYRMITRRFRRAEGFALKEVGNAKGITAQ